MHLRRRTGRLATLLVAALAPWPAKAQYEAAGPLGPGTLYGPAGSVPITMSSATQQPPERRSLFEPFVGIDFTVTSNANFDQLRRTDKQADFVTQISPGFRVEQYGAHSSLIGFVSVPILFYARTGGDNNRIRPDVNLAGTVDALDRHFLLDAHAVVSRQFLTPLGATPSSAVANTQNEYSSGTYQITPAFRGDLPSGLHYDVHDANTWTTLTGAPQSLNDAYTNEAVASIARDPAPLGGSLEYDRSRVTFKDTRSPPLTTQLARLRGDWAPDPELRLSASFGYEDNSYSFATYNDVIYGVGVKWHPSPRTSMDAAWEHRFFGSSWNVALEERLPLAIFSFRSSRDVTTYPQQLASFTVGQDIGSYLNALLQSRIADPAARRQAVDDLIRLYGLPATVTAPVFLYSQQARLVTDTRFTAGFTGVRNNVFVTLYRNRNQQVVQAGEAAGLVLPFDDVLQQGVNLVWSSRLSSTTSLTGVVDFLHSTGITDTSNGRTNNGSASLTVTTPISALTDFHYGIRYQFTRSNVSISTDEAAIYAGILHRFH